MEIWKKTLKVIQSKVASQAFDNWFRPILFAERSGDVLTLKVPNKFFKEWLSDNYTALIREATFTACGIEFDIAFDVSEDAARSINNQGTIPLPSTSPSSSGSTSRHLQPFENRLNPKYIFENFVVGSSNQLPHAASRAVAEMMGTRYNPLFIYGGTGLGKTHLIHAIGNAIKMRQPSVRICYISSEQFMNEFVMALQTQKIDLFRRRFRTQCDVLLMDDIQFIAGKDRTQDEFFHTFNALHEQNKQIVLTSDQYPQEMSGLEERLRSRFQWGLLADIQPPELETRLAILRKKAQEEGIALPDDVGMYLASSIKSNVRELEGTLISLAAHASLEERPIDLEFASKTLRKVIALHQTPVSVEAVQDAVCKHFNVSLSDLKGAKRHRSISFPRQIAMYLCRSRLNTSYPELGTKFGGKDHTTALAACRKIGRLVDEDNDVRNRIEALERILDL